MVSSLCVHEGAHAPIVTYDKNNVKMMFHVGRDRPRPDVVVVAVSVTSSNSSSVRAFTFQAAVPKVPHACPPRDYSFDSSVPKVPHVCPPRDSSSLIELRF